MERMSQILPPGAGDTATGDWAGSTLLYLMTCYDVWSATPPRGCDPAPVSGPEDVQEAA